MSDNTMSFLDILQTGVEVVENDFGFGVDRTGTFPTIPDGVYDVELTVVGDWTQRNATIKTLKKFDEKHQKVLDENGRDIVLGTDVPVVLATNQIRVKITEPGDFKGRIVFGEISNYPNTPWVFSSFLRCFGGGLTGISPIDFETLVGNKGRVSIKSRTYNTTVTNNETGMEEVIEKTTNVIDSYYGS